MDLQAFLSLYRARISVTNKKKLTYEVSCLLQSQTNLQTSNLLKQKHARQGSPAAAGELCTNTGQYSIIQDVAVT